MGILKTPRFRGHFIHRLDDKGRLRIPTKYREVLQQRYTDGLVLAATPNHLEAYPPEVWEALEERILSKAGLHQEVRAFMRYFISSAVECEFDKQGRILIPGIHRERVGIKQEVVLVGSLDHFEIWDAAGWQAISKWGDEHFDDLSRKVAELTE